MDVPSITFMNVPTNPCPNCGKDVPLGLDFCYLCGRPVTEQGQKIKRDDSRGCAFFVFLLLSMLFFLAGLSGVFLATRSSEFSDPALKILFIPGIFLFSLSVVFTGVLFYIAGLTRKTRKLEKPDVNEAENEALEH